MHLPSIAYDDGQATTLISTDVDGLTGVAEVVHEAWAQVVEVLIGTGLLAGEVGWIWPLPIFFIYRMYVLGTPCSIAYISSLFTYESICCKSFTALPEGLEQCKPGPCSFYNLYAKRDESRENARVSRPTCPSDPRTSRSGALGSLEAAMDNGVLQCFWSVYKISCFESL